MISILLNDKNLSSVAREAAATLRSPGTVALIPTETVYGLVCNSADKTACDRIYSLKKRREDKPLALFLPNIESLAAFGVTLPYSASKLAHAFCPGPITIVVPGPQGKTIGFRIPDHPFVLALLSEFGAPLSSTSANLSGEPATLSSDDALASLDGSPDLAIDGGFIKADSQASTVVFCADKSFKVLRHGPISQAQLEAAIAAGTNR